MLDVIVVGGGLAGLAAASELAAGGASIRLLEARDRLGGRIHTLRPSGVGGPLELGAEFVHSVDPDFRRRVESGGGRLVEVTGSHWRVAYGDIGDDPEPFEQVGRTIAGMAGAVPPDDDVASVLEVQDVPAPLRRRVMQYVEGYHAADARRASAMALIAAESGEESGAAGRQFRVLSGYDTLVDAFASVLPPDVVETGVQVRRIRWQRGRVVVEAETAGGDVREYEAASAIITVPVGVLAARGLRIDPEPAALTAALDGVAMGSALRVLLHFREQFWEALRAESGRGTHDASFFHTASRRLPVWWTQHPVLSSVLTGWSGGPVARRLGRLDDASLRARALRELSRQFGRSRRELADLLIDFWRSDWDNDPFARGAYSYVLVGGGEAIRTLREPASDTLLFAGEALAEAALRGTTVGAMRSGRAAARAWLER